MKETVIRSSIRLVVPSLLGAAGALIATVLPVYHTAFCGGPVLGG